MVTGYGQISGSTLTFNVAKFIDGASGPPPALLSFAPRQLLLSVALGIWSARLRSFCRLCDAPWLTRPVSTWFMLWNAAMVQTDRLSSGQTRRISGYLGEPSDKLRTKDNAFSGLDSAVIEPPSSTASLNTASTENSSLEAFATLSEFLSLKNTTSHPKTHSLDTIRLLYSFANRITTNILIKSLLRWRAVVDSSKIRGLFDHMVRCGYPMSEQWIARGTNVAFGTSAASLKINVPDEDEKIVFEKHVRPLYKMFIKALFARGDRDAARRVVGILRDEEGRAVRMRQERNQARWEGVQRKKAGVVKGWEKH
ncbi:hypothetical protein C0995_000543 [Termitomyces sp. Mi166|nr:hypothetical protein C0995_000543 [Termitomyces sp. Mi166\